MSNYKDNSKLSCIGIIGCGITIIFILLFSSCSKDTDILPPDEPLESTNISIRRVEGIFDYNTVDAGLTAFLRESYYDLPMYSDTWRGKSYGLVIVQGGEQPTINGVDLYDSGKGFWYVYSKQGGKQDRGDELIKDETGRLYEFIDLEKGGTIVYKNIY